MFNALKGNAIFHVAIVVVASIALAKTLYFDPVPPKLVLGLAPASFPQGVLVFTIILTVLSLIRSQKLAPKKHPELPPVFYMCLFTVPVFFAFAVYVDFLIALVAFIAFTCYQWGEKRPLILGTVAVSVSVLLFFIFSNILGIRFPRGILINIIYG